MQRLVSPWLAIHGEAALPRLFKVVPAASRIVQVFAISTPSSFHLLRLCLNKSDIDYQSLMIIAATSGQVDSIRQLQASYPDRVAIHESAALAVAAANGHLQTVKYLHAYCPNPLGADALVNAAAGGHLEIVKFLHTHRGDDDWSTDVVDAAAASGHVEVVQFLHTSRTQGCTISGLQMATIRGHLDVVRWIHVHRNDLWRASDVIEKAAQGGHLAILQYVLDTSPNVSCTTYAMDLAATHGHLEIVQFLHAHRTDGCTEVAMQGATSNGHDHVVAYLVVHGPELIHSLCGVCGFYKLRNHYCAVYERAIARKPQRMRACTEQL
ncbi:hypothetical protein DYB25_003222 [Aphanomyces astaci]|uniref:Uncharacterized protein n=1 Tax=Aphanomyces astaci TaxID=112090 RepID=A0A397AC16_APHAT|nr:hypothetical protein DYB36_007977 [Aphanomyces astaci]RHY19235.1 hypothetical protein DYB25_003222 [Aphanomyces astaci]RHY51735.1 hypothetical protein DYB38_004091 [Aphanomyces astaci]RHY58230.1 hypothetical protein DYB34_002615 [Aphanomyces astaci]RHY73413.1 hypothetical protein DYB30_007021 [Aphanomyces astaci]